MVVFEKVITLEKLQLSDDHYYLNKLLPLLWRNTMMKNLTVCSLIILTVPTAWAEEFYLEGITTLGAKKSAYLSMKGGKIAVREGESIGTWQVVRIEHNAVTLSTGQGVTTELPLHTRFESNLSSVEFPAASEEQQVETEDEKLAFSEGMAKFAGNSQLQDSSTPPTTVDPSIPAGYRKIQTPFGEVIVEEKKILSVSPVAETGKVDLPRIADDAIPAGQRRIRTPFGDVLVKEKSPTTPE
jgi:hypothetical protein